MGQNQLVQWRIAGTLLLIIFMFRIALAQPEPSKSSWPQWRGPNRDGQLPQSVPVWPIALNSRNFVEKWRTPLQPSYSGPIVSESAVITTETRDQKIEVVSAYDRSSGKKLWETSWDGSMSVPFFAKANGDWIRSTPTLDGDRLFVGGIRDVLVCLDTKSGDKIWEVDFVKLLSTPVPDFGMVCSPLVEGEFIYVQAGAALCKLNKHTGELLWKSLNDEGGMMGSAFSSPVMAFIAGRKQLLVQTREKLVGVDPENGKVLWEQKIPTFRGMNILTPTVFENSVFTSAYQGSSLLFKLAPVGDSVSSEQAWSNPAKGYMSSPVVIDGHVYLHLQNQRFTCIDLASGETRWTTEPFGKYWSLIANRDRILALDERGILYLIKASPEKFELIDKLEISKDSTWAHLSICGNDVFVRELSALVAYSWANLE